MKQSTLLFLTLLLLLFAACKKGEKTTEKADKVDTIGLMVYQIEKCSRLYTAEMKVHKIVTHNDERRLKGDFFGKSIDIGLPFGKRKIAIPIEATVKAYIEMDGFSNRNIKRSGQKIFVTLPDPRVTITASRIDHDSMKKYVPLLRRDFTDSEMTNYQQKGRKQIEESIPQLGIIEMARESAARAIIPMIAQLGYDEKNIVVSFRKDFDREDLPHLLGINEHQPYEENIKTQQ